MDCLKACEILSAAFDGEPVDAGLLADARAHAGSCAECRAFERTLARMAEAPAVSAPDELTARLEVLGAEIAAEIRGIGAELEAARTIEASRHATGRLMPQWLPRTITLASAAVVLLAIVGVGGAVLLSSRSAQQKSAESTLSASQQSDRSAGSAPLAAESATPGAPAAAVTVAPEYVSMGESVWLAEGMATPDPSTLTTAGEVYSGLSSGGVAMKLDAYRATGDPMTLFLRSPDGSYTSCRRVVRTLGRAAYGLTTGARLDSFGQWPTLPARFAPPQAADGSPTFTKWGFDDLRVDVYVPPTSSVQDGFAVAPGTDAGDPAAGNPGWTWWERID